MVEPSKLEELWTDKGNAAKEKGLTGIEAKYKLLSTGTKSKENVWVNQDASAQSQKPPYFNFNFNFNFVTCTN